LGHFLLIGDCFSLICLAFAVESATTLRNIVHRTSADIRGLSHRFNDCTSHQGSGLPWRHPAINQRRYKFVECG